MMKVRVVLLLLLMWMLAVLPVNADDSVVMAPTTFTCSTTQSQLNTLNIPVIRSGSVAIYTGYTLLDNDNPTPIVTRFDNGVQTWCRTDYERTNADYRGYGLFWDGQLLYAAFSASGVSGDGRQDFRRFTEDGWLSTYGAGNARIAVIARLNPANGDVINATFHSALLTNGNVNELIVTEMDVTSAGTLVVRANASSFPREIDGTRMVCTGGRPYNYTVEFTADLSEAIGAISVGCTASSPPPSTAQVPGPIVKNIPVDQSLYEGGYVTFQWVDDAKANWYRVYIINSSGVVIADEWFHSDAICAGICNLPPREFPTGTYAWYVAGWGADGQGPWSNATIFYVGQRPPGVITRIAPAGTVESALAAITWSPVVEAAWYRLYIISADGRIVDRWYEAAQVCQGAVCMVNLSELFLTNGSYTWWIMGWGAGGPGIWTPDGLNFELNVGVPTPVVPLTPSNGTSKVNMEGGDIIFQWQPQPNASWYRIYIGQQDSLAMVHDQWYESSSVCSSSLCQIFVNLNAGSYAWFVNSWGAGGFGTWNEGVDFSVLP